jgi:hypothetical protein
MDAMTAYQLQEGLILTEDESDRLMIEGKIISSDRLPAKIPA